ncbi:hypothetical protein P153DRAFT_353066 [Dothidotthia symphoricarpi CBS 119687]|uniref:F-box domain-containing protein n=1 Tax=Dothidotthia symphoricarpi CBS 119687 TaxID=1392245 RepID=A0A6A6AS59_9PLEO|nr:uncharacterized protein P153DRAFT_353066 [Dothidotthia symphoricarpi CBS 119687]KAF2133825.1 hypothetical protein P153DRAFT_353066 [Dothidotthia symphoricarpi CBS 119687]
MDNPAELGATSPASNPTDSAVRLALPIELWGEVLRQIDDPFTLWITWRQVSRTFRSEAERVFRAVYLPRLRIQWGGEGTDPDSVDHPVLYSWLDEESSNRNSARAFFRLSMLYNRRMSDAELKYSIFRAFEYKDSTALSRKKPETFERYDSLEIIPFIMRMTFSGHQPGTSYANDPDIPEMQCHRKAKGLESVLNETDCPDYISFNWKLLMDRFFAEEVYVRREQADYTSREVTKRNIRTFCQDARESFLRGHSVFDSTNSKLDTSSDRYMDLYAKAMASYRDRVDMFIDDWFWENEELYMLAYERRLLAETGIFENVLQEHSLDGSDSTLADSCFEGHVFGMRSGAADILSDYAAQL